MVSKKKQLPACFSEKVMFRQSDRHLSAYDPGYVELTIYSDGGTKVVEKTADGCVWTGYGFRFEKKIY